MNGHSKRERVDAFIRRAVREACQEIAFNRTNSADKLRNHRGLQRLWRSVPDEGTGGHYGLEEAAEGAALMKTAWTMTPRIGSRVLVMPLAEDDLAAELAIGTSSVVLDEQQTSELYLALRRCWQRKMLANKRNANGRKESTK
jgi:hypothetical protein